MRVLTKLGFRREGLLRQRFYWKAPTTTQGCSARSATDTPGPASAYVPIWAGAAGSPRWSESSSLGIAF